MRGKGSEFRHMKASFRITPACAGKSCISSRRQQPRRDHPRVCGEKMQAVLDMSAREGSPPRVRGKGNKSSFLYLQLRITPACAGKSKHLPCICCLREDHPRVCGEKGFIFSGKGPQTGSPPRVRGKVGHAHVSVTADRITPACAGKRFVIAFFAHPTQDHPRVCGEKGMAIQNTEAITGSPPRVRGKD